MRPLFESRKLTNSDDVYVCEDASTGDIFVCIYQCMYICTCIYVYTYIYIYVNIYIYESFVWQHGTRYYC